MDEEHRNLYFSDMPSQATKRRPPHPRTPVPAYFLYGDTRQPLSEQTVHVETIARRSALYNWEIAAHRHRDVHQLLLIFKGSVDLRLDEQRTLLKGPAIIVVPPGTVHSFKFDQATVGLVLSFAAGIARRVAPDDVSGGGEDFDFLDNPLALALSRKAFAAADIEVLGRVLLRAFECSAPGRDPALCGLLGALLAHVLRVVGRPENESGAATHTQQLVARFRHSVERRYRESTTIAGYARALDVSVPKLRRACRAALGTTPMALIHERRLVEAKRQLRFSALSVTQIAYYLGFEDPAYFSRFFTQRMRVSPRVFRQRDTLIDRRP